MTEKTWKATLDYFGLEGQVPIVTGAGNGIGEATATMLANLGAKVAVCDIEIARAERVAQNITNCGGTAIAVACDVGSQEQIERAVEEVAAQLGSIDILVNNAAGFGGGKTLDQVDLKEWDRLIHLNLTSAYMFSMAVLPYMKEKKHGKICNVSSGSGIIGDNTDVHYASAKAGLIGMTKEMATELMPFQINVNALGTGLTDTRMSRRSYWEQKKNSISWHRVGEPKDQAAAITYLVSEAAEYLTGQVICPNGGAWMHG